MGPGNEPRRGRGGRRLPVHEVREPVGQGLSAGAAGETGGSGAVPERQRLYDAVVLLRCRDPATHRADRFRGAGAPAPERDSEYALPGPAALASRRAGRDSTGGGGNGLYDPRSV